MNPTTQPEPAVTSWPYRTPAAELIRCYGSAWNIRRADLQVWVAERTIGTSAMVVAGPAAEVLHRLDCLPKAAGTIVRVATGGWLSGSCR
jgi:hypothetical protein